MQFKFIYKIKKKIMSMYRRFCRAAIVYVGLTAVFKTVRVEHVNNMIRAVDFTTSLQPFGSVS